MVIKTNYANKIYIKHQKQKKNQSSIIFITNWMCFKKILNEILEVNNVYYKLI
jgi:hypothetical protein